ncbi:MAG: hypothetical protein U0T77_06655 [Chitinophagales bacterium]
MGDFTHSTSYKLNLKNNGVYLMVIEGEIEVDGNILSARDAIGVTESTEFDIIIPKAAKLLAIEIPMQ